MTLPASRLNRAVDQMRPVRITRHYTIHAEGSVLIEFGQTKVLCTASVEEKVPPHKRGSGQGWVTAEYGMLPRATHTRSDREAAKGKHWDNRRNYQASHHLALALSVGIVARRTKRAHPFAKRASANRHFDKSIRNFGDDQCDCKQNNKLHHREIIAGNFSMNLENRPVIEVQAVRPPTEIHEQRVAQQSFTDEGVRMHRCRNRCNSRQPHQEEPALK